MKAPIESELHPMRFNCLAMLVCLWSVSAGCDRDRPPAAASAANEAPAAALASDREFVEAFVHAVNSGEAHQVRALVHPDCLSRIDDTNRAFMDQMMERDVARRIPPKYDIEVKPIGPGEPLPFEGMVEYPIRPTHHVQISFENSARQQTTLMRQALQENGAWWLVMPIPSPETVQQVEARQAEARQIEAEARRLAGGLDPAHREEILALLNAGQRVEAIKRCAEICGVGLAVARQVVDELSNSDRD